MKRKLPHGVIPRTNFTDPLDASRMTLAEMRKYPYILWLKYIEPKIVCMGTAPEDCWCWDVDKRIHDMSNWYPQAWISWKPDAEQPVMENVNVRRFIAQLFFEFPNDYVVYRNKNICPNFNCVRPGHFLITPRNDKEGKFGTKNHSS